MTIREQIKSMNRESQNGYETTFMMHYLAPAYYRWELARYPVDVNRLDEPTETVLVFEGRFDWQDAIDAAKKYLADHPEDGFCDA